MKIRSNMMNAMRILRTLFCSALLAGFLSSISCATASLSTRTKDGPIKVFKLGQRIPRNSKTLNVLDLEGYWDSRFLIDETSEWGHCSYRAVVRLLKKEARARGGDALAILHVRKPFLSTAGGERFLMDSCYRVKAFLLDLIDIGDWPRVGLTEEEIRRDLDARKQTLDDIEGIWASHAHSEVMMDETDLRVAVVLEYSLHKGDKRPTVVYRVAPSVIQAMKQLSPEEQSFFLVAILKDAGDPDYPYAAYILDPEIPEWQAGFLKARLRKLPDSSGYEAKWYGSTFQADLREFHPDEAGALTTKVVIEQGLTYSIEQTLTRVYPPTAGRYLD